MEGCLFGKLLNSQTFLFDTDLQALGTLEEEDGGKIMSGNDMAKTTSKQSLLSWKDLRYLPALDYGKVEPSSPRNFFVWSCG